MDEHMTTPPAEEPAKKTPEIAPLTVQKAVLLNGLMIAVAVIIGAFIIVHGPFTGATAANPSADSGGSAQATTGNTAATTGTGTTAAVNIQNVKTAGEPFIGNPNAPVTLAYWSDYQCPYCKEFETQTLPTIVQNYVNDGKVKVVFKDFSFLGPDSTTAALYARAVWSLYPDSFFAWRTAMFDNQGEENSGFDSAANIAKLTATISGIDVSKVQAAVAQKNAEYLAEINADKTEGANFGIEGTPSFIVGTQLISGVEPYATFSAALDAQLKQ